jgi:hypothetical protein
MLTPILLQDDRKIHFFPLNARVILLGINVPFFDTIEMLAQILDTEVREFFDICGQEHP